MDSNGRPRPFRKRYRSERNDHADRQRAAERRQERVGYALIASILFLSMAEAFSLATMGAWQGRRIVAPRVLAAPVLHPPGGIAAEARNGHVAASGLYRLRTPERLRMWWRTTILRRTVGPAAGIRA